MIKFIKKALLEFLLLECLPIVILILLAMAYALYAPEHWGILMLLSIIVVNYICIKLFIKSDK